MSNLAQKLLAVAIAVVCVAGPSARPASADSCTAKKLRAVARKELGLLTCQGKVAAKGNPGVAAACEARVIARFNAMFGHAGACAGTLGGCEGIADDCRDQVRAALPDGTSTPSACEAKRLKSAGKKASRKLICYARAANSGRAVDGACLADADTKFTADYNSVSGCTGDGQVTATEALVDQQCVTDPVLPGGGGTVSAACPVVTTSTSTSSSTTTTTSSSTTTTTNPCGNGVVDPGEECDPPGQSCGGTSTCQNDCTCTCDLTTCPCDFLDPSVCLYPYPSDWFTVADATTDTGKRLSYPLIAMPKNVGGTPIQPADYNLNDGFSQGSSILTRVPGLDLAMTGASPVTNIARSLDADSPTVIVNADTLAHHLHFAELDANASSAANKSLILHPSVNFAEGGHYIVALRNMKDSTGAIIPPNAAFLAYRDNVPTGDPAKEARRPHMESLFTTLAAAGVARSDLYLAWDFTVASERNITERLLSIRDDAFTRLGTAAPSFTVSTIEENVDANIFRRVTGTYQVERYVDSTTPPARFVLDANGIPIHQATTQPAPFQCIIPFAALPGAAGPSVPARASIYGHGLLGSYTEVSSGNVKAMANEHNFVFCATDWIGMANGDALNAVGILQDLGKFPTLTDRLQQSMVDQLFLARLMIHPSGFVANAAFQDSSGNPVIDTSAVFYDGNSQGGIFGGTVMAVAQDITRGVLGVPGMNYSLLLTRSTDFAQYSLFLYPAYPNQLTRPLLLALIQQLWDRSDPNGYAAHIVNDPLPNTPSHQVLLHEAFGDHQVANVATEIEARTIGISTHTPVIGAGRSYELTPQYGIPGIASYPFNGSALVLWDSGAATPPITNTAPQTGADPHSDPRNFVNARTQKSEFLKTGGAVVDVCPSGAPCTIP